MHRTPVSSSNIASVGYSQATSTLEVGFHSGSVYQYRGVPAHLASALVSASSVGSYFARYIKGQFPYRKL